MAEGGEKTEMPTPKKLRDVRQKGQVCNSKDCVSTAVLLVLLSVIGALALVLTDDISNLIRFVGLRIEENDGWMIVHTDEVETIEVKAGETTVTINADGIVINDGTVGMAKTDKVVEWMSKVYADLQNLKTLLSVTPVAGNGAPLGITFTSQTPQPNLTDFANDKIKH